MSATGLAVFDRTLQETNLWLKELMARLGTDDRTQAYGILKATLHALRDRIGPENATHLAAQLPILLRGVYYEGWRIASTPSRERHVEAFLITSVAKRRWTRTATHAAGGPRRIRGHVGPTRSGGSRQGDADAAGGTARVVDGYPRLTCARYSGTKGAHAVTPAAHTCRVPRPAPGTPASERPSQGVALGRSICEPATFSQAGHHDPSCLGVAACQVSGSSYFSVRALCGHLETAPGMIGLADDADIVAARCQYIRHVRVGLQMDLVGRAPRSDSGPRMRADGEDRGTDVRERHGRLPTR